MRSVSSAYLTSFAAQVKLTSYKTTGVIYAAAFTWILKRILFEHNPADYVSILGEGR
jgi:hypothetical protein